MQTSAMTTFNDNVRKKLTEKGLTIQDLAEKIGMYREALSKILNCKVDTTLGSAERIADGLEVPLHELITPAKPDGKKQKKKAEPQAA